MWVGINGILGKQAGEADTAIDTLSKEHVTVKRLVVRTVNEYLLIVL